MPNAMSQAHGTLLSSTLEEVIFPRSPGSFKWRRTLGRFERSQPWFPGLRHNRAHICSLSPVPGRELQKTLAFSKCQKGHCYANEATGLGGRLSLNSFRMGTGHRKDQPLGATLGQLDPQGKKREGSSAGERVQSMAKDLLSRANAMRPQ